MKAPVNSRYAHCEGITDVGIFEGTDGIRLVTCGADGDVRVWVDPEDQDPVVFSASDSCLSLICHKDRVYVGTESNTVESYGLPKGKPFFGNSAKFTAAVNHVDISKSGDLLVAGSGDMTFQIIKLQNGAPITSTPPIKVEIHTAPVLSVAIDPSEEFIVSVGCDGCAYIWNMAGKQLHFWDKLFPSSNDITNSSILCRPSWHPQDGKFIAIPGTHQVVAYARGTWNQNRSFKSSSPVSICKFSPCGNFLAGGCTNGTVTVWDFNSGKVIYENVDTKDHISGLVFSKCGKNIFAVDLKGRLISVMDYSAAVESQAENNESEDVNSFFDDELNDHEGGAEKVLKGAVASAEDDAFDDGMDDLFGAEDELDPNEISISKIKAMTGFIASEKEDVFVGIDKARAIAGIKEDKVKAGDDENEDDNISISSAGSDHFDKDTKGKQRSRMPSSFVMPFTDPQKPFQPASTPEHLEHRFMTWNEIGIIRNYPVDNDETDAIDVEFHDIAFHTAIHMRNTNEYCIAALGKEAAVFSSKMGDGEGSKLMCLHFASWDTNKEWIMTMPKKENITGLAIGSGWLAAATDSNRLRLFTIGGVQKGVVEIGGQIIAISGHEDLLFVTFHNGFGLHGTQCISYSILRIRTGTGVFPLISCEPLPLSPKAELTWVGFSDEGTPAFNDSRDCLRVLIGRTWTVFNDMKENLTGESDHFWVTGLSIATQNARVIKCKGMRYPSTIPKPTIILLDAKIPLCEMETEKSNLEDGLLRYLMLTEIAKKMDKKGFDVEEFKDEAEKTVKENSMKLFAMSCKGNRDFRASEYVSMMPTTLSIQLAIKYAAKIRKLALVERLAAIGRRKLDEEAEGLEDFDGDFENIQQGNIIYSSVYANLGGNKNNDTYNDGLSSSYLTGNGGSSKNTSSADLGIMEENPLLRKQRAEIREILSASVYSNPFKKSEKSDRGKSDSNSEPVTASSDSESINGRGLALIDVWKKPSEKTSLDFNPKGPKVTRGKKAATEKEVKDKAKATKGPTNSKASAGKKQATLLQMGGGRMSMNSKDTSTGPGSPVMLETGSEDSMSEVPSTEDEVTTERKRKRYDTGSDTEETSTSIDEDSSTSEKKSRISSKLALFSRASDDS